jgi:hypothetical protein
MSQKILEVPRQRLRRSVLFRGYNPDHILRRLRGWCSAGKAESVGHSGTGKRIPDERHSDEHFPGCRAEGHGNRPA